MPTELLIALIAFVAIPMGLMCLAAFLAYICPADLDPFANPDNWGSQDIDRRKK